jgi:hypothetical protein
VTTCAPCTGARSGPKTSTATTWAALQAHADIQAFIAWVAKKPPGFYTRTFTSNEKKRR